VTIVIGLDGVLEISTSLGTNGSAQIRENLSFDFEVDARLILEGRCTSGRVLLMGQIQTQTFITAVYSSQNLVCDGVNFDLTGQLEATR